MKDQNWHKNIILVLKKLKREKALKIVFRGSIVAPQITLILVYGFDFKRKIQWKWFIFLMISWKIDRVLFFIKK
jgi:hypothetical protein